MIKTKDHWLMTLTRDDLTEAGPAITKDWHCIDCGNDTAPGFPPGAMVKQMISLTGQANASVDRESEVYMVTSEVWKDAGVNGWDGCLCIKCLEKRIGRKLRPTDFTDHIFNEMPGTPRLLKRRKR